MPVGVAARILVVDDNAAAARALQLVLRNEGYEADIASSATAALAMAHSASYDAALIDIALPERSGIELLSDLKARFPELVAIMVTGRASTESSVEALNRGADGYAEKPVDVQHLLTLLRDGLDRQRLQSENRRMLRRLSLLYALASQVSSGLEAETTLQETISLVVSLLDLPTGGIWWSDGPDSEPLLAAAAGLTDDMIAALSQQVREARKNGNGSSEGRPPWFDVKAPFGVDKGTWHGKLIPLRVPEGTVGYLAIGGPDWVDERTDDAEVLSAVAWQIAVGMENMRLYGDLKAALEQLQAAQAQIVQAEKLSALGRVVSGVAHEINNPLMVILGYADILREDAPNPEIAEVAERIYSQAERAGNIVRHLLAFARSHRTALKPTNLRKVIEETLESTTRRSHNGKVRINVELPEELPPVAADPGALQQVFTNLITNAQHAIGDTEGLITISGELSQDSVTVVVRDTGPGISQDVLPRIFDPFFTTKKLGEGTGLGLSVCHGIINDHGGTITAANAENGGAVFTIRLPLEPNNSETAIVGDQAFQDAPWLNPMGGG